MMGLKKLTQALAGIVLLIGLVVVLIELFSSAKGPQAASSTIDPHATSTPTPVSPYSPSNYGLPNTIAGYKVLAVLTDNTLACMMPGKKRLILQANQASIEDYLKASDPMALDTALHQVGLTTDEVEIEVVGPTTTLDGILLEIQKWNEDRKKHGCVTSAPAIPLTPTQ